MKTMGERCKARRLELGIKEVAELARQTAMHGHKAMTRSALSQIENGITMELKYGHTVRLADALGVNHEWLAFGTGNKIKSKVNDPAWAAAFSPVQRDLLETIRLYGSLLLDDQCAALVNLIRSMVGNGKVKA